jgi:hypothetical protein
MKEWVNSKKIDTLVRASFDTEELDKVQLILFLDNYVLTFEL